LTIYDQYQKLISSVLPLELLEKVNPDHPEDHHQGDMDQGYHFASPKDFLDVAVEFFSLFS